jgi:short-subunit dehydrogenase
MTTQTQWALVTGACSGIGLGIARELAARGYSLVVVSNRGSELERAAQELAAQYQVVAHPVVIDLARPEAAADLYLEVSRLGAEVEVLVSNAGMLFFGEVAEADPARVNDMLQLQVVTPSLLAHYFGRDMRARRHGHMLLVSSAASWCDFPGIAFYGGSKRYLRGLAASLREELRPWGVSVTCLAPGAVATGLYDRAGGAAAAAAKAGLLGDPARVARAAVRGMLRRKALVLPGAGAKLMAVGSALTPRWLIRLIRCHTDYLPRPDDR